MQEQLTQKEVLKYLDSQPRGETFETGGGYKFYKTKEEEHYTLCLEGWVKNGQEKVQPPQACWQPGKGEITFNEYVFYDLDGKFIKCTQSLKPWRKKWLAKGGYEQGTFEDDLRDAGVVFTPIRQIGYTEDEFEFKLLVSELVDDLRAKKFNRWFPALLKKRTREETELGVTQGEVLRFVDKQPPGKNFIGGGGFTFYKSYPLAYPEKYNICLVGYTNKEGHPVLVPPVFGCPCWCPQTGEILFNSYLFFGEDGKYIGCSMSLWSPFADWIKKKDTLLDFETYLKLEKIDFKKCSLKEMPGDMFDFIANQSECFDHVRLGKFDKWFPLAKTYPPPPPVPLFLETKEENKRRRLQVNTGEFEKSSGDKYWLTNQELTIGGTTFQTEDRLSIRVEKEFNSVAIYEAGEEVCSIHLATYGLLDNKELEHNETLVDDGSGKDVWPDYTRPALYLIKIQFPDLSSFNQSLEEVSKFFEGLKKVASQVYSKHEPFDDCSVLEFECTFLSLEELEAFLISTFTTTA